MYIARILYPVEVLGCGKRVGIWFNGCPHHCDGCSNPELWEIQKRYSISLENVMELINSIKSNNHIDGFTITGGEPFYQAEALDMLTEKLTAISDDILIYSGYELQELHELKSEHIESVISRSAVLIDGKYIAELNNNCTMKGSENQQIHIFNNKYRKAYEEYLSQENRIQNFTIGNSVISVGIHKRDFKF
jgi:anaerobic ribonucleoside-triphosphate reductase activating protein